MNTSYIITANHIPIELNTYQTLLAIKSCFGGKLTYGEYPHTGYALKMSKKVSLDEFLENKLRTLRAFQVMEQSL